eukprot:gene20365-14626_t
MVTFRAGGADAARFRGGGRTYSIGPLHAPAEQCAGLPGVQAEGDGAELWAGALPPAGADFSSYAIEHDTGAPRERDPTGWRIEVREGATGKWRTADTVTPDDPTAVAAVAASAATTCAACCCLCCFLGLGSAVSAMCGCG